MLQDPAPVARLLIGQGVDLFTFDLPDLSAGFAFQDSYAYATPVGAFTVTLSAGVGISADVQFGCDLLGRQTGNLLNGFFVRNARANFGAGLSSGLNAGVSGVLDVGVAGRMGFDQLLRLMDSNGDG